MFVDDDNDYIGSHVGPCYQTWRISRFGKLSRNRLLRAPSTFYVTETNHVYNRTAMLRGAIRAMSVIPGELPSTTSIMLATLLILGLQ
jgi:hypothetical protein